LGWKTIPHEYKGTVVEWVISGGCSIGCRADVLVHTVNH
jgi:hypothetical protein